MALAPGTRLGAYEIVTQIGAGGMGEVYRAIDTNLKRAVAIKVLPDALAADADRLARFQREAEVLASLNDPHIAAIYGIERSDGKTALVMELIEGPTLADRLAEGPIPVDEALAIARQIARALEVAHEQGIVHRDLKPANIKVRHDGTVKILDFGLAKFLDPLASNETGHQRGAGVTNSPTMTSPAMTAAGIILGTAAYMSPEQARGKSVDKRTDVWAFGCVLYEMLTGERAFVGDDVSDVLASILAREPDWRLLPPELPTTLAIYIKRCLHKDRMQRVRDMGDIGLALEGAFDSAAPLTGAAANIALPAWRRGLPVAVAILVTGFITVLVAWRLWPSAEPRAITRFDYELPADQLLQSTQRPVIAVSGDGRHFIYQVRDGLYVRSMDNLDAHLVPGTVGPLNSPILSPDSQWVGYFASASGQSATAESSGKLQKVAVAGGTPVTLASAKTPYGVSWSHDNTILFGQPDGIMRVSANGGTSELIIRAGADEVMFDPRLLPDGDSVLFSMTTDRGPARWDRAQVVVQSIASGKRTVLVEGGSHARYLPTGYLVYAVGNGLFGAAFNAKRLTVGGALPLVPSVQRAVGVNAAGLNYDVSDEGTLVYVPVSAPLRSLVWIDRNGTVEAVKSIPPGTYEDVRLSREDDRALLVRDGDIWIYELASGRSSRLTRDGTSLMPVWNPTGTQVAYSSATSGNLEAWVVSADGSGQPRQLTTLGGQVHVDSWSPDGRMLAIHHHRPERFVDMLMLPMDRADAKPEVFFDPGFNVESAHFSRDLRYLSYVSQESGRREIYIRPYPGPGGQVTVSVGGGQEPIWAKNGDVFYRSLDGQRMYAVSVSTQPTLKVGTPAQLFQGPYFTSLTGSPRAQYDLSADGQRFLMLAPSGNIASANAQIVVVQNWTEELKALVPLR